MTYESRVIDVTTMIWVVFFPGDQFIGFSESSGPSKSTTRGSLDTASCKSLLV